VGDILSLSFILAQQLHARKTFINASHNQVHKWISHLFTNFLVRKVIGITSIIEIGNFTIFPRFSALTVHLYHFYMGVFIYAWICMWSRISAPTTPRKIYLIICAFSSSFVLTQNEFLVKFETLICAFSKFLFKFKKNCHICKKCYYSRKNQANVGSQF